MDTTSKQTIDRSAIDPEKEALSKKSNIWI